jgi:anthranilate synthase component I
MQALPKQQECIRTLSAANIQAIDVFARVKTMFSESFFYESAFHESASHESASHESAPESDSKAAITVIGIGPFETMSSRKGSAFKDLEARARSSARTGVIPFEDGGIFGCIGFDCVVELEPKLARRFPDGADMAHSDVELVVAKRLIVFEHALGLVHLISKGVLAPDLTTGSSLDAMASLLTASEFVEGAPMAADAEDLPPHRLGAEMGKAKFLSGVAKLKGHIQNGDIFQAVLAETFYCQTTASALEIFSQLRKISPTPYSFFFSFGDRDFFGASPETLVRVEGGRMHSHPIAGTRPRGVTKVDDKRLERQLLRSRKEAAEHLMLVDLARNDVGRVARTGSVKVCSYRTVQRYSNVMHLVSKVEADLKPNTSPVEALKACFPAGTLSGAPKFRAMELISEIEPVSRGLYGGGVVACDFNGNLDACIAIRSLELCGGRAILRAGAGIVADSNPEAEYQEIHHKLKPLRQALAAAENVRVCR